MTKTTAPLQWMHTDFGGFRTVIDAENCRFLIHRQPGIAERYTLERVNYGPGTRSKPIVVRQLRNIKTLAEARRIAQEDWS